MEGGFVSLCSFTVFVCIACTRVCVCVCVCVCNKRKTKQYGGRLGNMKEIECTKTIVAGGGEHSLHEMAE